MWGFTLSQNVWLNTVPKCVVLHCPKMCGFYNVTKCVGSTMSQNVWIQHCPKMCGFYTVPKCVESTLSQNVWFYTVPKCVGSAL